MQDIADAAALAGAAHLGDSDRDTTVKDAVKAYVEANGIKLGANDFVNRVDGSAWDAKDTLAKGQDALVSYGIVSVTKDGETRDRVRVRITKRAPLFFFNVLGDFSDGMVVAAKAAAEGGSEGQPATYDGPRVMTGGLNLANISDTSIQIKNGDDFSVFSYGNVAYTGLPKNATGTIYQQHQDYDTLPVGYQLVPIGTNPYYKSEEQEKASKEAMQLYEQKKQEYLNELNRLLADIESYKRGEGNKRYIGEITKSHWDNGQLIVDEYETNIKPEDTSDVDLFFAPSHFSGLTNQLLKNIKFVQRLVVAHELYGASVIGTDSVRFGNIYSLKTLNLSGSNNCFDGLIYSNQELYIRGWNNKLWVNPLSNDGRIFNEQPCYFGMGRDILTPTTYSSVLHPSSGWKVYIGIDSSGSGGSSGTGSEGSTTTTKLRLVE